MSLTATTDPPRTATQERAQAIGLAAVVNEPEHENEDTGGGGPPPAPPEPPISRTGGKPGRFGRIPSWIRYLLLMVLAAGLGWLVGVGLDTTARRIGWV